MGALGRDQALFLGVYATLETIYSTRIRVYPCLSVVQIIRLRLFSLRSLRSFVATLRNPQWPASKRRFEKAGEAWDVALQFAALRGKAGLSQKDLGRKLKTSQQQISRLESLAYEGHSLSMLRRVAKALGAMVRLVLEPETTAHGSHLAESSLPYRIKRVPGKV